MLWRRFSCLVMGDLARIADVEIDAGGVFKYILIKVSLGADSKLVVRGDGSCGFHADIFDKFIASIGSGFQTDCLGGGRIDHKPEKHNILVYGYSQGFGIADHQKSVNILKKAYPNYSINFSNDGY